MVKIAASDAMVILTTVLPMMIVMSNWRGCIINLATRCSFLKEEDLKLSISDCKSEKKAVSEPEKNAESPRRIINAIT